MAITFTRAPTVAPGQKITSTQLAKLAAAFNDRLRSGLGDPTFRIFFYWLSIFRQVRKPDKNLWPPLAEFFERFQMLDPVKEWPEAPPDQPQGANLACQIMSYIFGLGDIPPEWARMTEPDPEIGGIALKPDATDADLWALAKQQRGAIDLSTGDMGSPAWTAARSFYSLVQSVRSEHGNAYGGYLPSPDLAYPPCVPPSDDQPAPINYRIKFTRKVQCTPEELAAGCKNEIVYPGTCIPSEGNPESDHVAWIDYLPWAYVVHLNSGDIDTWPTADYMEGPYTGEAKLRKTSNGAFLRLMNKFAGEYRGTETQRSEALWTKDAFQTQQFLTSQYHLAPNRGTKSGAQVVSEYPLFRFAVVADSGKGKILKGQLAIHSQSGNPQWAYHSKCVFTACLISAAQLEKAVTIELIDDKTVISSVTVEPVKATPEATSGPASLLFIVPQPLRPKPLKIRAAEEISLASPSATFEIECTEILEMKPSVEDLFLLVRAGGARISGAVDGSGVEDDQARRISDNYFNFGCITNVHGAYNIEIPQDSANPNGLFDCARRFSQSSRMINRQAFHAYAVENGKSILWFKRFGTVMGKTTDLFKGIAPAQYPVLSGNLVNGRLYVVRNGSVTYSGASYSAGKTFTAGSDGSFTGTGEVYEYNGIRHVAEQKNFTNEWLMGVQLKAYRENSVFWKLDSYSDFFPLVNRCHFFSPEIAQSPQLTSHFAYGQKLTLPPAVMVAESPSGYNYAPVGADYTSYPRVNNINEIQCREGDNVCREEKIRFYRSCRIYEPDVEIESATTEFEGAEELIKLTFKGRLHHDAENAPASISRNVASWDVAGLRAEAAKIRTVENALREYLVYASNGTNATDSGKGNQAYNSLMSKSGEQSWGSVIPHFMFTQLIPSPYMDANDNQDNWDTRFLHDSLLQMELYLRAMCEGYVDGSTSADVACRLGTLTLFDYTFSNLCFQAFGDSWFHVLPLSVRKDNPQGFGPLPTISAYASMFNEMSSAVNLLDTVRVMLPMRFLVATDEVSVSFNIAGVQRSDNEPATCGDNYVHWKGTPQDAPIPTQVHEFDVGPISVFTNSYISGCDGAWKMTTTKRVTRTQWIPMDPDAKEAMPPDLWDMVMSHSSVLAKITTSKRVLDRQLTDKATSEACCLISEDPAVCRGLWHFGGENYWVFPDIGPAPEVTCGIMPSIISAPAPPESVAAYGITPNTSCAPGPRIDISADPILPSSAMITVPLS